MQHKKIVYSETEIYEDFVKPKKSFQKNDRKKIKTSLKGLVESGRDIETIEEIVSTFPLSYPNYNNST